jgi:GNAT superfamily N-acetyltransferase
MIHVRPMSTADLPLGMRLKTQAGWNQLEPDWLRFLELEPDGAFVAELDGVAVGTLASIGFGPVAWIAMVLVDTAVRRRGVGRALMEHALALLDACGIATVRLDATPLGQPLYEQLGFATDHVLTRFEGVAPHSEAPERVQPARREHLSAILDLDRAVTRTERGKLLQRLYAEEPAAARVVERDGILEGYLLARPGARARFVGPCIARGDAGPLLLADAWHRYAGEPVFVDVPDGNTAAVAQARAAGLTPQRTLTRMSRGVRVEERVAELWASAGPETG